MTIGSKLKKHRLLMNYTLKELSEISGLSVGYLSKMERSDKIPPLSTLQLLASKLKLNITELIDEYEPRKISCSEDNDIHIVRHKNNYIASRSDDGYDLIPLTNNYHNRYISPFLLNIPPGSTSEYSHDAEEFNYVIKGPLKLKYKDVIYTLSEGDSFYFDSRKPHVFINENEYPIFVLSCVYIYRKF
jgi:transcriptional regulator with XRE-family HTH domain